LNPGALSKAAAGLASVEGLTSGRAAVFLSICAQTGKDGTCFISQGKLGKRCGITRKHAHDSVAWLIEKGLLEKESVDGRSCKYTVVGCNLSDTGVSPERHRGVTSETHVSSITSSNTSFRSGRRPRRGPSPAAGTTPTERYEPPTDGMSFAEWKARLA
jgi:hypothetical protein